MKLWNKKTKRLFCILGATVLTFSSAIALAGCETSHPQVSITINFDDDDGSTEDSYTINYKLFRNLYPQTVNHFIEIAESGYYDGLCFHDYQDSQAMYSGAYTYNAAESEGDMAGLENRSFDSWFNEYNEEKNAWGHVAENKTTSYLTSSVFEVDKNSKNNIGKALKTLVGEFEDNGRSINTDADNSFKTKNEYGALTMYYESIGEVKPGQINANIATKRNSATNGDDDSKWYNLGDDYRYNATTSLFYIQTKSGSWSERNNSYCTFGQLLSDKDKDTLKDLIKAINNYKTLQSNGETEGENAYSFTNKTVGIDPYSEDAYLRRAKTDLIYEVPEREIHIQTVKVTKY